MSYSDYPINMSEEESALIRHAISARQKAFAPFSGIRIGVSIITEKGNIYAGCNVENSLSHSEVGNESLAGYHAIHAEESAVASMIMGEKERIKKIVLVSDSLEPITPCPLCTQVLLEFSNRSLQIVCLSSDNKTIRTDLAKLIDLRKHNSDIIS